MLQGNSAHEYTDESTGAGSTSILDQYIPGRPNYSQKVKLNSRGNVLTITKKNGRYPVALLAGGPRDLASELQQKLARGRGLFVKYHLDYSRQIAWGRPLPRDVDLVIILKDMMSHENHYKVVALAKSAGVRFVRTQRKLSHMVGALYAAGLANDSLPEQTIATMRFDEDLELYEEDVPEEQPPKFEDAPVISEAIEVSEAVSVPVLGEVTAKAPLIPTPSNLEASVSLVLEQAISPMKIPELKKGQPSPQLACLASTLFRLCSDEGVSVLCTPNELTFNPVR